MPLATYCMQSGRCPEIQCATVFLVLVIIGNRKKASVGDYAPTAELVCPTCRGRSAGGRAAGADPVQAGLIPAHVTLCRDELGQVSAMEIEARLRMAAAEPVTLGFGRPVS